MGKSSDKSILDFDSEDRIEIRYNSEWLKNLNLNCGVYAKRNTLFWPPKISVSI